MFYCRTTRLANYLMKKGCRMVRVDNCYDNPHFLVFLFEKTDELYKAVEDWKVDKETFVG